MIFLYTLTVAVLGVASFLVGRRAARLEGKYARAAAETDKLLRAAALKQVNCGKPDVCQAAKQQYLLGCRVQQRDVLEQKYVAWQHRADRLARWAARVGAWKGKKLPYTLGVADVSGVLWLVDYLGAGDMVSVSRLVQLTTSLWQR